MSQFVRVNQDKCTGCGVCVDVCPYRLFRLKQEKAFVEGEDCFLCGHCRAVCSANAIEIHSLPESISLEAIKINGTEQGKKRLDISKLVLLMQSRRSCRNYNDKTVPELILSDLARIGAMAPSGTNCQSWEFTILPEREDVVQLGNLVAAYYKELNRLAKLPLLRNFLKAIGKGSLWQYYNNYYDSVEQALTEWEKESRDRLFHGATAAIIVSNRTDASCPQEDALLATQNILLAAESIGLGSCLIGFAVEAIRRSPRAQKKIGIPFNERVYAVICLGYPEVRYIRAAGRRQIKPRILKLHQEG